MLCRCIKILCEVYFINVCFMLYIFKDLYIYILIYGEKCLFRLMVLYEYYVICGKIIKVMKYW